MAAPGTSTFDLPRLPFPHSQFISHANGKDGHQILEVVKPYNEYEAKLREIYAQDPDHQSLKDPHVNAVPIFKQDNHVLRICPQDIDDATHADHHIIPLSAQDRLPAGAPATVASIQDFKKNFNLFSESSLADLDWSNVVAAGSSVVTPLLPVPAKYNTSKKALRYALALACICTELTRWPIANTITNSLRPPVTSISSSGAWTRLLRWKRSSRLSRAFEMPSLKRLQYVSIIPSSPLVF